MILTINDKNGNMLAQVNIDKEIAFKDLMEDLKFDNITFGCMSGACGICKVLVEKGRENIVYFSDPLVVDKNSNEVLTCISKISPKTEELVIKLFL